MRRHLLAIAIASLPLSVAAEGFFTLKGHGGPIMGIAVSETDRIATASFDNAVGLWGDNGTPEWLDGHEAAVNIVHFAGDRIASGADDYTVRLWPGGAVIGRHQGKVMALADNGQILASASWDGTIGLWPLDGGEGRMLRGHASGVNALAFSGDGTRLYSASTDGTLRVWDVATGMETRQVLSHGFGINEMILNEADGWIAYGAVDGVTRIVDAQSGDRIADFTLERRPILSMTLSPDRSQLAVGDGEGFIMVIDTAEWRITRDFRATQRGPIWALAFSRDGQNIHAGGLDPVLYSWPVETLTEHDRMGGSEQSFLRDPAEMDNGERQFQRKCSICHTLTGSTARRAGPTLAGLFGRRAGTVADYIYSDTLDGSDIVWNETTIDALFDEGPDHYIPGSKMPMQRITNATDRDDLIAFLRQATQVKETDK
jgi:cytochrome c